MLNVDHEQRLTSSLPCTLAISDRFQKLGRKSIVDVRRPTLTIPTWEGLRQGFDRLLYVALPVILLDQCVGFLRQTLTCALHHSIVLHEIILREWSHGWRASPPHASPSNVPSYSSYPCALAVARERT